MFAQVDIPHLDIIESDTEPNFRFWEEDDIQGVSIGINGAVVVIYPIDELARKLIEITKGK